mmetsp:Transcript_29651/g.52064  ORF Transcript_29651/g.52064 Transcript_29651/m.52064 type:complete len:201 (+) Transcript_29651:1427-2029(+)
MACSALVLGPLISHTSCSASNLRETFRSFLMQKRSISSLLHGPAEAPCITACTPALKAAAAAVDGPEPEVVWFRVFLIGDLLSVGLTALTKKWFLRLLVRIRFSRIPLPRRRETTCSCCCSPLLVAILLLLLLMSTFVALLATGNCLHHSSSCSEVTSRSMLRRLLRLLLVLPLLSRGSSRLASETEEGDSSRRMEDDSR